MNFIDALYTVFLIVSGIISAFAGGIILRRRSAPGAGALLIFLFGTLAWTLTYAMHWVSPTSSAKRFWLDMTYLGVVITPGAMLLFILEFTHRIRYFSGRRGWLLAVEPVITLILLWTDPVHNLFYGGKRIANQSLIYDGGPWFWVNVIYSYGLILLSIWLLLDTMRRPNQLQRDQARLVLIGSLFPVAVNVITFTGFRPFPGLDMTPVAFTFTGIFLSLGLIYYRLLDLVPIGRDVLVENLNEGMLLLDSHRRILDVNPAARTLLALPGDLEIGQTLNRALAHQPALFRMIEQGSQSPTELVLRDDPLFCLQVQVMPVSDRLTRLTGTLVICHDITQHKLAQLNIENQLRQIEELQASLKDQAIRDALTGAYNLRYLQETLPRELARAARDTRPLSLVMIDVDDFKNLNDTYGHPAGDAVLQRLCAVLSNYTREGDIITRYGGDEFLVVLAAVDEQTAHQRAETWRNVFEASPVEYGEECLRSSISLGIAAFPAHAATADQLIRMADLALYRAKSGGRNRTMVYLDG